MPGRRCHDWKPRWMDGGRPSPRDAFCLLLPSPVLMAAFSARPLRPVKTPIAQRLLAADVTRILPSPQRPSPHPHVCQDTCAIRRHLLAATPPSPAALPRSEAGPSDSLLRSSPPCVAGRLARTRRLRDEPRGPPETPSGWATRLGTRRLVVPLTVAKALTRRAASRDGNEARYKRYRRRPPWLEPPRRSSPLKGEAPPIDSTSKGRPSDAISRRPIPSRRHCLRL